MLAQAERKVELSKGIVFSLYPSFVKLNGKFLCSLPDGVDLNKLEDLMREDKKLNFLMTRYEIASTLAQSYEEKMNEIIKQMEEEVIHSFIYDYPDLTNEKSEEVKKEKRDNWVCYSGNNFELCTLFKKKDFSGYVKEIDEALRGVDPNVKITVYQGRYTNSIFFNGVMVYNSDRFHLRDLLSYLKDKANEGKLTDVVQKFKELYELEEKRAPEVELFLEIADRVSFLAYKSKD